VAGARQWEVINRIWYHNARIIEANETRLKEKRQAARDGIKANAQMTRRGPQPQAHPAREPLPIKAMTPEDREQHRLREAQTQNRRAMYKEQKRDRDVLREAQTTELN